MHSDIVNFYSTIRVDILERDQFQFALWNLYQRIRARPRYARSSPGSVKQLLMIYSHVDLLGSVQDVLELFSEMESEIEEQTEISFIFIKARMASDESVALVY